MGGRRGGRKNIYKGRDFYRNVNYRYHTGIFRLYDLNPYRNRNIEIPVTGGFNEVGTPDSKIVGAPQAKGIQYKIKLVSHLF